MREARGKLSAREIANRAGINRETLWQIENGRRRDSLPWSPPKPPIVLAVARALHIDEAEALELAGYRPEDYITPATNGGPMLVSPPALAEKMTRLPQHELRALQTLVEGLLQAHGYIGEPESRSIASHGEVARSGVRSHGERVKGDEQQMPKQERARD